MRFLYEVFIMHCTADFCMRYYARFSQIGSHIAIATTGYVFTLLVRYIQDIYCISINLSH